MDLTPSTPAPNLFSLRGQNILITGATRGNTHLIQCANLPLKITKESEQHALSD